MDALVDHQDAVETAIHGLLRPLVDQELSVVFYDMTTIRAEGASEPVSYTHLTLPTIRSV